MDVTTVTVSLQVCSDLLRIWNAERVDRACFANLQDRPFLSRKIILDDDSSLRFGISTRVNVDDSLLKSERVSTAFLRSDLHDLDVIRNWGDGLTRKR